MKVPDRGENRIESGKPGFDGGHCGLSENPARCLIYSRIWKMLKSWLSGSIPILGFSGPFGIGIVLVQELKGLFGILAGVGIAAGIARGANSKMQGFGGPGILRM